MLLRKIPRIETAGLVNKPKILLVSRLNAATSSAFRFTEAGQPRSHSPASEKETKSESTRGLNTTLF